MSKFKKVLSAAAGAASRPAESWRVLRRAVRELHLALQGLTALVGELEVRLDRLEAAATQRPAPAAPRKARRTRGKHTPRKAASRKGA